MKKNEKNSDLLASDQLLLPNTQESLDLAETFILFLRKQTPSDDMDSVQLSPDFFESSTSSQTALSIFPLVSHPNQMVHLIIT